MTTDRADVSVIRRSERVLGVPALSVLLSLSLIYLIVQIGLPPLFAMPVVYPLLLILPLAIFTIDSRAGVAVLFVVLLFQNVTISALSALLDSRLRFQALQGTNFALLFNFGATALLSLKVSRFQLSASLTRYIRWSLIGFLAILIYSAYGLTKTTPASVMIYFRYASAGILAGWLGIWIGLRHHLSSITHMFFVIGSFTITVAVIELFFPDAWYSFIDAGMYHGLKSNLNYRLDGQHLQGITVKRFLNLPLGIDLRSLRFMSTVLHHVSYAYVLAVMGLCAFYLRHYIGFIAIAALLALNGSKGPLTLILLSVSLYSYNAFIRKHLGLTMLAVAAAYVGAAIIYGLAIGDQHVIGFLSGLSETIRNPLGHGIGIGGNLSAMGKSELKNWREWRSIGASAFALESAIGVLIYQMGLASISVFAAYGIAIRDGLKNRFVNADRRSIIFVFALFICLVNGIFQEEAFSPYALGMLMLFCGTLLGNREANTGKDREAAS